MPIIDIKNLSVGYFLGKSNEVRALSDVSLKIEPGEFIIFFGASGCGKSTLLYTIAGLERPTAGEVLVTDINLANMKNKELEYYRQHTIGMVFQAFHLIPSLSIVKNIMLPQIAIGGDPKKRREEAERLMKYFGVYEQRNKVPNELSGGQQQRVAICRALINDPEIIFADEPVGNLDSKSAHDVLGLIQELNIKDKKTVILVTHDPSHLDIADRVFFMKDGKVIDTKVNKETRKITVGTPAEEAKKSNLELVSKTLATSEHMGIGGLFLEYKVKEIVSDALTGLTIEEVSGIEHRVSEILKSKLADYHDLEDYLDREYTFGGLDLNKRTAHRLTGNIRSVVEEMKTLVDASASNKKSLSYVEQLRFNLLDAVDVYASSTEVIDRIENIIRERVEGRTDRKGVQAVLDSPIAKGGAGFDRRNAKRMSKHLELLLLTRYDSKIKNDKGEHLKPKNQK
ncbi:MAG TPA: ABC transporter ATP-binding protein [Candidatus Magasanikbacteria bacterium]|nr:ABC transporter ATP-binding protein [Candidatus Magasanikbacteria bacterium]